MRRLRPDRDLLEQGAGRRPPPRRHRVIDGTPLPVRESAGSTPGTFKKRGSQVLVFDREAETDPGFVPARRRHLHHISRSATTAAATSPPRPRQPPLTIPAPPAAAPTTRSGRPPTPSRTGRSPSVQPGSADLGVGVSGPGRGAGPRRLPDREERPGGRADQRADAAHLLDRRRPPGGGRRRTRTRSPPPTALGRVPAGSPDPALSGRAQHAHPRPGLPRGVAALRTPDRRRSTRRRELRHHRVGCPVRLHAPQQREVLAAEHQPEPDDDQEDGGQLGQPERRARPASSSAARRATRRRRRSAPAGSPPGPASPSTP